MWSSPGACGAYTTPTAGILSASSASETGATSAGAPIAAERKADGALVTPTFTGTVAVCELLLGIRRPAAAGHADTDVGSGSSCVFRLSPPLVALLNSSMGMVREAKCTYRTYFILNCLPWW